MKDEAWRAAIDHAVDEGFDQAVALRRHMHMHPEISGHEERTTLHLYQLLGDAGFASQIGPDGCGVVADWKRGDDQPLLAIRADIDALRIHDEKDVAYRSQCDGIMHACGHDAHSAIVFAALSALRRSAEVLPRPLSLRGIFQPAEETCQGAREMIAVGALDNVDGIFATHVDPTRRIGKIGIRNGVLTANCDDLTIRIVGQSGHAARPHESRDPIVAAAHLINAIYQVIPRAVDSQDPVVVTVGQVISGDNPNVIPEEAVLRGTIRTLNDKVREQTFARLERLASGVGQSFETKITVEFRHGCESVLNDVKMVDCLRRVGVELLGADGVEEIPRPSMGSEDFAFYTSQVPGAMFRLGCSANPAIATGLHTPTFDVDEEAIRWGARLLAHAAVRWSLIRG